MTRYIVRKSTDLRCYYCFRQTVDPESAVDSHDSFEVLQEDTTDTALIRLNRDDGIVCKCGSCSVAMWVGIVTKALK